MEWSQLNQAFDFKDLIVSLPGLDSLEISVYDNSTLPASVFEFHTFPSISRLSLQNWPFKLDGPKAIQHQLDCAKLESLSLTCGYVLPYCMTYRLRHTGLKIRGNCNAPCVVLVVEMNETNSVS